MWKKVDSYSLYWDASDRIGTVYLKLSDDTEGSIKHLSKMEMAAFGDTLRNEDPGAPDPELNTSPIIEDTDEEFEVAAQEVEDLPVCFFNNSSFPNGEYVCSGSGELLHCDNGLWIREGTCEPDNQ